MPNKPIKQISLGTSLAGKWIRIHLPMQETEVRSRKIPHAAEQLSPRATTAETGLEHPGGATRKACTL